MSADGAESLPLPQQVATDRVVATMLIQEVYRFLVAQKLATNADVQTHLRIASEIDGGRPTTDALKKTCAVLSQMFRPDNPPAPGRPRLLVIEGGLSDKKGSQ